MPGMQSWKRARALGANLRPDWDRKDLWQVRGEKGGLRGLGVEARTRGQHVSTGSADSSTCAFSLSAGGRFPSLCGQMQAGCWLCGRGAEMPPHPCVCENGASRLTGRRIQATCVLLS